MSEPNVQREDNPPPQGEGDPESFEVADEEDVMPARETLPGGDDDDIGWILMRPSLLVSKK